MSDLIRRGVATLIALLFVGCYASHGATDLPDGGRGSGAGECRIRFHDPRSDRDVECAVASSSTRACSVLAECVCRAWNPGAPEEEISMCAAWETTPRGAITLADFCTEGPPARMMLDEAARGYIGFGAPEDPVETSEACASTPALIGR